MLVSSRKDSLSTAKKHLCIFKLKLEKKISLSRKFGSVFSALSDILYLFIISLYFNITYINL